MLSAYSSQSLEILSELLPDLFVAVKIRDDYFEIETVSPTGWSFWISSANDEITVGFAEYHTHFGWHQGDPLEDALEAGDFVKSLRSGHWILAVRYKGSEYKGSQLVEVAEFPRPQTWFQRWWRKGETLTVKKWSE